MERVGIDASMAKDVVKGKPGAGWGGLIKAAINTRSELGGDALTGDFAALKKNMSTIKEYWYLSLNN